MAEKIWPITEFFGGLSDSSKRGFKGSFRAGVGLNFYDDPDSLTAQRKLVKNSGSTIEDAPNWMVTQGTNLWVYDASGNIYKRTSAGTWSKAHTVSNSSGNGLAVFDDYLYYSHDIGFGRYGPLSGTPAWDDNFLVGQSETLAYNIPSAGNTYTPPVAVSETAANKYAAALNADYVNGVALHVVAKGTGNWTLILHDASNNEVARKTIANADLTSLTYQKFQFDSDIAITSGDTYHAHIISTVADGTVRAGTAADFSTARINFHAIQLADDIDVSNVIDLTVGLLTSGTAYTLLTTINEDSVNKLEFVPDKSNISGISLQVYSSVSANVTVTIHDDKNNTVGSVTGTAINMGTMGFYRFNFASALSVIPGATYHVHVTSSAGSNYLLVSTSEDLSSVGYKIHYQILNDHEWHPMVFYPSASALAIGNGNHLAVYDGIAYRTSGQRDGSERLTVAKEENIRCLDLVGDYLAMGTWKGDTIDDHGSSNLYLWDGNSAFVNAFKSVVGEINAIKTGDDGLLYIWHGGYGHISVYDGGLTLVKIMPNISEGKYIETYPGAVTNWKGKPYFGISNGDATDAIRGVYSYGRKTKDYPRALNFEFPISTGTVTTNAQITSLLGIGPNTFFVGWKDNTSYGVDLISTTADQATTSYSSMRFDAGEPYFEKNSKAIKITHEALTSGQSIKVYTKKDRASSFTLLFTANTVGDIETSYPFDDRWKELELKVELITTGNDAPVLTSIAVLYEVVEDFQE